MVEKRALPWKSFVPERVTTLMTVPELRPNSASKFEVSRRNSWTASGRGLTPDWPPTAISLLLAPSSRKLLEPLRWKLFLTPC